MLNTIHRFFSGVILVFVVVHLSNHLVAIFGVQAHIDFMEAARSVYRNVFVEILLLVSLVIQLSIGLFFVYRSWNKRTGFFQRIQAVSGCYLVFFLIAHVGAVLNGRSQLNLDTNFYFAVAGIHI